MFVTLRTTKIQMAMDNKEYTMKQEQLARFAKAMGHPARVAILEFLIKQNSCFSEIFMRFCPLPRRLFHNT